MILDDDFEPRLGRMRGKGGKGNRRFLHTVLAAANLARGGGRAAPGKPGFSGSRIGRGAGVGRVLARRDRFAAFRHRRVIIKSRIVRLAGKGMDGARAHLRYIAREGTKRDGARGALYGAETDQVDGKAFLSRQVGDRHHFRFIVSAEDGADYDDLRPLTRRLMARVEQDLGTRLDWVAVDHFDTGHPHTHIIMRGTDARGHDLVIARDYLSHGMRERACELVDLDLGPRTDAGIEQRLRAEVDQERLTTIDRAILRDVGPEGVVAAAGRDAFDQTIRTGRLKTLERLGLARRDGELRWRVAPDLADTLRRMGERGDIVRTMQRALTARDMLAPVDCVVHDPTVPEARPLVGRVMARGLSDELNDRQYLIIEATDGRAHFVDIGRGEANDSLPDGAVVRVAPVAAEARDVDRTVAAVAAANGGRYDVDLHLRHDPSATQAFAETHVRRLEAIRRVTGGVFREPDGSWSIAADHLDGATAYEAARARDRPVVVTTLSPQPLDALIEADAATWLDAELVAADPLPLRDAGFGHDARLALERRRQWLLAQGFAEERDGTCVYPTGMVEALRRRELARVEAQLARELGMPFAEAVPGERVTGVYRRAVATLGGRYALIETSRAFTLVPWRPALERHLGKSVSGELRKDGVSWTIGRGRSGPGLS